MSRKQRRLAAVTISLILACSPVIAPGPLIAQGRDEVRFEPPVPSARVRAALSRMADIVRVWGMIQRVAEEVAGHNAREVPLDEVQELDRAWSQGREPEALSRELLTNDCAQALQSLLAANPGSLSAVVADARGTVVCMTSRAPAYWLWQDLRFYGAWDEGRGAAFVSQETADEATDASVRYISVPVLHEGRVVGVLIVALAV